MTNAQKFYQAMNKLGLSEELIRSILPDWWDDELFNNVASRAMAEIYISRATGKGIIEMREVQPSYHEGNL